MPQRSSCGIMFSALNTPHREGQGLNLAKVPALL